MYKPEKTVWDEKTWARILEPGINRNSLAYDHEPKAGKYSPEEIALACFGDWPVGIARTPEPAR